MFLRTKMHDSKEAIDCPISVQYGDNQVKLKWKGSLSKHKNLVNFERLLLCKWYGMHAVMNVLFCFLQNEKIYIMLWPTWDQIFLGHILGLSWHIYCTDFHDLKAIWNPVGPRCALAWSFSLRGPGGLKRAQGAQILGYDICYQILSWFSRLWYWRGFVTHKTWNCTCRKGLVGVRSSKPVYAVALFTGGYSSHMAIFRCSQ